MEHDVSLVFSHSDGAVAHKSDTVAVDFYLNTTKLLRLIKYFAKHILVYFKLSYEKIFFQLSMTSFVEKRDNER